MTVDSANNRTDYNPNGINDTFAYDFRVDNADDLVVYFDGVEQVGGYTVTEVGNPLGGDVVFDAPPSASIEVLTLLREVPLTQQTAYPPLGPFPAKSHEQALDKLTFITQQLQEQIGRAALGPVDSDSATDFTLPSYSAGEFWRWDPAEQKITTRAAAPTLEINVESIAALRALDISPLSQGDSVFVNGYYTDGDGGGGPRRILFKDQPAGTYVNNGGSVIVPTGGDGSAAWLWEWSDAYNIKWFGAKGDGTNDSTFIQAAIDTGKSLVFTDGSFNALSLDFNQSNVTYTFDSASLVLHTQGSILADISANNISIIGADFSGGDKYVSNRLVNVTKGVTGVEILNCTFRNIKVVDGDNVDASQYGLQVDIPETEILISECAFRDINHYNYQQATTSAFNGGISLIAVSDEGAGNVRILGCRFDNIWTDNISGNIDYSDSDGIRVYAQNLVTTNIVIANNVFTGIQKSAVKASGSAGLIISNTHIRATRTDVGMIAGIRVQNSDKTLINGVIGTGNFRIGINVRADNVEVNNVVFNHTGTSEFTLFNVQSEVNDNNRNITFKNSTALGVHHVFRNQNTGIATENAILKGISIINCEYERSTSMLTAVDAENIDGLLLKNVKGRVSPTDFNIDLVDCNNIVIEDCTLDAKKTGLDIKNSGATQNSNNIKILNCSAYRATEAQTFNGRFLIMRAGGNNIIVDNIDVSVPTYDVLGNTEPLIIEGTNIIVTNAKFIVRNEGGGQRSISMLFLNNPTNANVSDVTLDMQDPALQTTCYASFISGGEKILICNVNSNSRGVDLSNSNNVGAVNIAAAANPLIDTSATNVTKSNIITWA